LTRIRAYGDAKIKFKLKKLKIKITRLSFGRARHRNGKHVTGRARGGRVFEMFLRARSYLGHSARCRCSRGAAAGRGAGGAAGVAAVAAA